MVKAASQESRNREEKELRRERPERCALGIDLEREAAIPKDDEVARLFDSIDDPSIASAQSRIAAGIADELDPRAHAYSRPDASQEVSCALGIHGLSIDTNKTPSIPHSSRFRNPFGQEERPGIRRSRGSRRTVRTRRLRARPPARRSFMISMMKGALGRDSNPEDELARALGERRTELEEYAARFEETARELGRREEQLRDERAAVERLLRRSTVELEAREKELVAFERELQTRDERLRAAEGELARRRSDLGAVELKRAALEQRERALDGREAALDEREATEVVAEDRAPRTDAAELYFVPGSTYRLVEAPGTEHQVGTDVELEGERYRIARVGPSPLPRDTRRCAYLVRAAS